MASVQDEVALIKAESERLGEYLRGLPQDAWSRPSACDRWGVRDVVGHQVWVAEFYADTISRGMQGDATSPDGSVYAEFATSKESFHQFIARSAIARRESLGQGLLEAFSSGFDRLNRLMAALGPQDWSKPCSFWHFLGPIPAQGFIGLTIQELVIHEWDIRSGLDPSPRVSEDSLPALLDRIPTRLSLPQLATFRLNFAPAGPVRYRFSVTGPVPSTHDIVVEDNKCRMEPAGTSMADVTLRCDTDTFVLLMYQRLPLDTATGSGRLMVEGDRALVSAFDRWLKGE